MARATSEHAAAAPVTVTAAPCATGGSGDADKDGIIDGCDTNNGAERPKAFKTVNATVVSGEVFVKLPAGSSSSRAAAARKAPKGFKRLLGAETIPVGATLDTAHGRGQGPQRGRHQGQEAAERPVLPRALHHPPVADQEALQEAHHRAAADRLVVQEDLQGEGVDLGQEEEVEEARPAPVRQRQGLVPHQRAQRGGDRPRHALERPGPLRRHAGHRPARPRRGPRQGQAQDRHRAHGPYVPRQSPLTPRNRLRRGWARSSSSRRGPGRAVRARSPAPRWCWAAAASPAASMRSARCGRSTSCRSTAASTSSTSTSAPAPAR